MISGPAKKINLNDSKHSLSSNYIVIKVLKTAWSNQNERIKIIISRKTQI